MRAQRSLGCFFLLLAAPAAADEPIPGPVPAEILRVVDADTLAVRAHIWPGHSVETRVRLAGVDAPEVFRPACPAEAELGEEASAFVESRLPVGASVFLHEVRLGSFAGRVIGRVALPDGSDLGALLVTRGLAVPDGAPSPWCPTELASAGPEPVRGLGPR
ncbi:MAG: thermonuclease family protein [Pseudomonadota bacterium]